MDSSRPPRVGAERRRPRTPAKPGQHFFVVRTAWSGRRGAVFKSRQVPESAPAALPSGAPDGPADTPSRTERVLDAITLAGGLLCAAAGLTVMAAWFARATAILRLGSQHPMAFNTALAVTVTVTPKELGVV